MSLERRLRRAVRLATTDVGAWPLGILGFLVRGGLVVVALPLLTLPTPVGIGTLLGPAVVSTGRFEGPLRTFVLTATAVIFVAVAAAIVLAAIVEGAVADRRPTSVPRAAASADRPRHRTRRLIAVELLALAPLGVVLAVCLAGIVDEVRDELLLPGDLAVPFLVRVVARIPIPLAAFALAVLLAEAIDGLLSRRVLLPGAAEAGPPGRLARWSKVATTATFGWLATLIVLVPGLAILDPLWQAARVAWTGLGGATGTADPTLPSPSSPEVALAVITGLVLAAAWCLLLLLCGIASLVRAELWSSRLEIEPGTGRGSETGGHGT